MKDGHVRPKNSDIDPITGVRQGTLFPEEKQADRIVDQLMYFPPKYTPDGSLKTILLWNGASARGLLPGRGEFLKEKCPVSSCFLTTQRKEASTVDLILFKDHFTMPRIVRRPEQIWMIYMLGSFILMK